MLYKISYIPLLLLLFFSATAANTEKAAQQSALLYNQELVDIKAKLTSANNSIASYGAGDIYTKLEANLARFKTFAQNMQSVPNLVDALKYLSDELNVLADNFREIANMAPGIEDNANLQLTYAKEAQTRCKEVVALLQNDVAVLEEEIHDLETQIILTSDPTLKGKLIVTKKEKESVLNSRKSELIAFEKADVKISEIVDLLEKVVSDLAILLHAINSNANVYDAAAGTVMTYLTLSSLTEGLEPLEDLTGITDDLIGSWDTLNGIVSDLNQINP